MKKFVTTILFFLVVWISIAQRQKVNYLTTFDDKFIHFGFSLGINTLDFNVANFNPIWNNPDFKPELGKLDDELIENSGYVRSDVGVLIPGFTVGIITSMRLSRDLNLRFQPGLSFGERNLTYNVDVWDTYYDEPLSYYSIKSTFLDFPILIKYKARRINNDRPYLLFGTAYRQDISRTAKENLVSLTKGGFYAELGAGWDHYFIFFRFSIEAKISIGLNNQIGKVPAATQRQYYAQSIKSLRSNIFTLSFHFE